MLVGAPFPISSPLYMIYILTMIIIHACRHISGQFLGVDTHTVTFRLSFCPFITECSDLLKGLPFMAHMNQKFRAFLVSLC